ncbi:MAG: LD-carboxypeptidase [Desulfobulbaceae bacterium]|uniref:LD-carboxypeptidase n=1 Tax=Candidatus Desulfatifera sulfidica TaxID=2841691 RepID=A0A8J6N8S3_9BACT|nr:LD-carboxypeptidase [Candidatus Desulfatifera sulfidica]
MTDPRLPAPLKRGDVIGIIAPAGQIANTHEFETGLSILNEMGYEPRFPRNLWPGTGYLADNDSARSNELQRMWLDDEVAAVMTLRGGYGCLRLAPQLNFDLRGKKAKFLIGFSDITILHTLLFQQTGMISLHGPVLTTLCHSSLPALERFFACLAGQFRKPIEAPGNLEILRGGDDVCGDLIGGNLSSMVSLLGTPFVPEWQGKILFLEEVGEPLYRIDRMLMQLSLAGVFNQVHGIILGDFMGDTVQDTLERMRFHEQAWGRIVELTAQSSIPIWANFPIGHMADNLTLPHGAKATMDSYRATLSFD